MQNQICFLTLLFFSVLTMQVEKESLEKVIEDANLNSFKETLNRSGALCNENKIKIILKICDARESILVASGTNQALFAQVNRTPGSPSNERDILHMCLLLIGTVCTTSLAKRSIDLEVVGKVCALCALYDMYTYAKECKQKVKELEEKGDQLKTKLDVFKAMIKLIESHSET